MATKPSSLPELSVSPVAILLCLYLAQGVPGGVSGQALQAILRSAHVSLTVIGYSTLLALPWALKVLWSPLVDAHYLPRWGRARSWVLPLLLLTACVLLALALYQPALTTPFGIAWLFVAIFLLNLCAATQDIATDGLAVRLLPAGNRGMGNAVQVGGYRLGMIIGGSGLLAVLDVLGWQLSFAVLALFMLLLLLPVYKFREPELTPPAANVPYLQVFMGLLRQPLQKYWLLVLCTSKLGEGLASVMVKPMFVDMGFSLRQIGLQLGLSASLATLLGAGMGVWWVRAGQVPALLWAAVAQGGGLLSYAWLAWQWQQGQPVSLWLAAACNAFDHWASGVATVVLLTVVMGYCRHRHAGADFTLQVSLITVCMGVASLLSGHVASAYGYSACYLFSVLLLVLSLWPIVRWEQASRQLSVVN